MLRWFFSKLAWLWISWGQHVNTYGITRKQGGGMTDETRPGAKADLWGNPDTLTKYAEQLTAEAGARGMVLMLLDGPGRQVGVRARVPADLRPAALVILNKMVNDLQDPGEQQQEPTKEDIVKMLGPVSCLLGNPIGITLSAVFADGRVQSTIILTPGSEEQANTLMAHILSETAKQCLSETATEGAPN